MSKRARVVRGVDRRGRAGRARGPRRQTPNAQQAKEHSAPGSTDRPGRPAAAVTRAATSRARVERGRSPRGGACDREARPGTRERGLLRGRVPVAGSGRAPGPPRFGGPAPRAAGARPVSRVGTRAGAPRGTRGRSGARAGRASSPGRPRARGSGPPGPAPPAAASRTGKIILPARPDPPHRPHVTSMVRRPRFALVDPPSCASEVGASPGPVPCPP